MAIMVQDAGALRTITGITVKQAGVLRTIRQVKVQDGGVLRTVATFADPLAVASDAAGKSGNSSTLTTSNVTASVSGGFAPYTYAWTLETNGGGTASTTSAPTMATTTFTKTNLLPESDVTDVWRCTVTDDTGEIAFGLFSITFLYLTGA